MEIELSYLRDIHCTIVLHQGAPEELLEVLKDVDLIVVGTSGETGFRKATLGSIAETVFRSSAIPVLTVGPHCGCSGTGIIALDTVLYATDFSPGSAIAMPYALSIARRHAAKLVLLHVTNDNDAPFSFERTMASEEPLERLRNLVPHNIDLGYEPTYVVGFGTPGAAIIEEAGKCEADVIVLGARGTSTFASAVSHFGGGTAYHVASEAPCPALTIRYS
jgi:nucleotide-binding universal stress UspA family protein